MSCVSSTGILCSLLVLYTNRPLWIWYRNADDRKNYLDEGFIISGCRFWPCSFRSFSQLEIFKIPNFVIQSSDLHQISRMFKNIVFILYFVSLDCLFKVGENLDKRLVPSLGFWWNCSYPNHAWKYNENLWSGYYGFLLTQSDISP